MNTTQAGELVLKTDTVGRVRTPLARREQLLDELLGYERFSREATIAFTLRHPQRRRPLGSAVPVHCHSPLISQIEFKNAGPRG